MVLAIVTLGEQANGGRPSVGSLGAAVAELVGATVASCEAADASGLVDANADALAARELAGDEAED